MTSKQKLVLDWIEDFLETHGFSPSYQEIADGVLENSKSGAHGIVRSLINQGYLIRNGRTRGLESVRKSTDRNQLAQIRTCMVEYETTLLTELEFTMKVRRILSENPA